MSSLFKNFNRYAKYGTVPAAKNNSEVPQNSFYKSVHYIDNVVGPVKDMLVGVSKSTYLGGREKWVYGGKRNIIYSSFVNLFLVIYTGFAYLMYLPHKLFSYLTGTNGPESLVGYANNFQDKAEQHGGVCTRFLGSILSYVVSAVIWAAALVVTPLVWTIDKVASKFSDANAEGVGSPSFSK